MANTITLDSNTNQAKGLGQYAIDFFNNKSDEYVIDSSVYERVTLFHTDAALCGISALAYQTNAPTILQNEAFDYPQTNGAFVFGSNQPVSTEKAIVANASAMREWDSNGTVFGYNKDLPNHQAGEFGHNDYYSVAVSAAQAKKNINGEKVARAMICIDEIRGRLSEVFSLKTYKIDHVVYGAIASAAVYGAMMGANSDQIESAIGMVVAHYIPYRAIRAGKQLSDSKGASAALSTEVAILSMKRAMKGFEGPKDIFRNPEAIFCLNEKPEKGHSPFNIVLTKSGADFAVMGMHFKLGLYEHQSAAAIEGVIQMICKDPTICKKFANIKNVMITAYEPAFGIIGDPNKRNPTTRQSADHSMVYIISTLMKKAYEFEGVVGKTSDEVWKQLMLVPEDYSQVNIHNKLTRFIMENVHFQHGGPTFDKLYPDGIPTTVDITFDDNSTISSGMIMYPTGHARNTEANLSDVLENKFQAFAQLALNEDEAQQFIKKLNNLKEASSSDIQSIYTYQNLVKKDPID